MDHLSKVNNWIEKNKDEILQSLSELIRIRTENIPPKGNEKDGQEYLYNKVLEFIPENDIDIFEIDEVKGIREHPLFFPTVNSIERVYKNRPNLVAKLKGTGDGKSLVFSGHIDTMPASGEEWKVFKDPFSGKVKDGKMYGRGSMDMKAGTLSGFYALKCLCDLGIKLNGDVFAESVIDEENGGVNGSVAARLRNPEIDFAILAEPTDLTAGIETIGGSDWKVSVKEKGAGGFGFGLEMPNPVYKLSKIAIALEKYDRVLKKIKSPDSYKDNQFIRLLTFQLYTGGSNYCESGSVPTKGHIFFWLETFAYMKEEEARKDFLGFMRKELEKYNDFKEEFPKFETIIRFMRGHKTDTSHPAMSSIKKTYKDLDLEYKENGLGIACDAYVFKEISNTDIVVLGPAGENPHGIDECVCIESIFNLIKVMVLTAVDYCS